MTTESREQRLQLILHAYLQALDRGEIINRQTLLDAHPDLRDELAEYFADASKLEAMAKSLKTASFGGSSDEASPSLGKMRYFGDYELLKEIARGGMGVVYKAKQVSLNRVVALKMILKGEFASEADVRRFRQEAEAAANLDHSNIVPIFEVGDHEGQQYFSMKLIEPGERKVGLREVAATVAKVARAVHHAHQRGILHRDLKPSNILIDAKGEPHVADFGLAKKVEGGEDATKSGAIVGTPAYMAPEQARAEKSLTTAVDVYSMGAILYEWLTGRPPFRGDDVISTLMNVIEKEPVKPRTIDPRIDRDLETIALKCLQKEPSKRYGSAEALADDLERWQRGEPIAARRAGHAERFWRWCRRNPVVAGLTAAVALSLFGGLAFSIHFAWQAEERAADAERAKLKIQEEQKRTFRQAYATALNLAGVAWDVNEMRDLRDILQRQLPENTGGADLRGFEWFYWQRLANASTKVWSDAVRGGIPTLSLSRDGQHLTLLTSPTVLTQGFNHANGSIRNLRSGETFLKLPGFVQEDGREHLRGFDCWTFSPDGKWLVASEIRFEKAAAEDKYSLLLLEPVTGAVSHRLPTGVLVPRRVSFSADGERLAVRGLHGEFILYDLSALRRFDLAKNGKTVEILDAVLAPDGHTLAMLVPHPDMRKHAQVEIWQVTPWQRLHTLPVHGLPTLDLRDFAAGMTLAYSADGKWLAYGTRSRGVVDGAEQGDPGSQAFEIGGEGPADALVVCAAHSGQPRYWLKGFKAELQCVAFSPDGQQVAAGGRDGVVHVWSFSTRRHFMLKGHGPPVRNVLFTPDGTTLISCGDEGTVRFWDARSDPALRQHYEDHGIRALAPHGDRYVRGAKNGLEIVERTTAKVLHTAPIPNMEVQEAALDDQCQWLATVERNLRLTLWNQQTEKGIELAPALAGKVAPPARGRLPKFSPDGRFLAAFDRYHDSTFKGLQVWDTRTYKSVLSIDVWHGAEHAFVCFTGPNELWFHGLSQAGASSSRRWRLPDGVELVDKTFEVKDVRAVAALHAKAGLALHGDWKGKSLVSNWPDGTEKFRLPVEYNWSGSPHSIAFSHDGRRLAFLGVAPGGRSRLTVLDTDSGAEVFRTTFTKRNLWNATRGLCFAANDRSIILATDAEILVWEGNEESRD